MKCTIPEIAWHNRDPVLCIDIQPIKTECYRLASGGTDCHILVWCLRVIDNDVPNLEVVADLTRHQKAVNVVRWSPTGTYLASGDDDGNIIIWKLKTDNVPLLEENTDKEQWIVYKVLRGHKEDVYDICWSPNELKLLSGSIDNTAIIWDLKKGKLDNILSDHKGFVQGVAWDPDGDYLATLSSDRTCRIFDNLGKQVIRRIKKGTLPVGPDHELYKKDVKLFHDDTFKSYFRRLSFTPDGNFIITPSGCIEEEESKNVLYCALVFSLHEANPVAVLPTLKQNTVAIRCCPTLFKLREDGPPTLFPLPYRMVIAIATDNGVILYDTQQCVPFAHLQKIHYTRLTDITWSPDGLILACSSTDGFCTIVTFASGELGIQYEAQKVLEEHKFVDENKAPCDNDKESINESSSNSSEKQAESDSKPKTLNILEKWAIKSPNDLTIKPFSKKHLLNEKCKKLDISETIEIEDSPLKPLNNETVTETVVTPRRIVPIKIGECNKEKIHDEIQLTPKSRKKESMLSKEGTTRKRSSILNLQDTPPKKKKLQKKAETDKKLPVCETDEARDAWNCSTHKIDSIQMLEDSESEFKLELTIPDDYNESTCPSVKAGDNPNCLNNLNTDQHKDSKTTISEISTNNSICKNSLDGPNDNKNADAKSNDHSSNNDKSTESIQDRSNCTNKISLVEKPKGRRVPLITLSGPKSISKK